MIKGVILDLDGTVYLGQREVPGAAAFTHACRRGGIRCLFVTNRTNRLPDVVGAHLRDLGIAGETDDVLTASQATAQAIEPGSVYMIGEDGLRIPLEQRGFTLTDGAAPVDYVIVGFDRAFNYDKLFKACRAIHRGAVFVATNPDHALTFENVIMPGTGAIVAAVATGSNRSPLMIGKPEPRIMDMALRRLGMAPDAVIAVGDNLATDIPAGARAGMRTALILTGVSRREDVPGASHEPTWIIDGYDALGRIVGV